MQTAKNSFFLGFLLHFRNAGPGSYSAPRNYADYARRKERWWWWWGSPQFFKMLPQIGLKMIFLTFGRTLDTILFDFKYFVWYICVCIICTLTDVLSDYTLQICPKLSMTWGTTKLGMRVLQVKQQIYSFNQKKTKLKIPSLNFQICSLWFESSVELRCRT